MRTAMAWKKHISSLDAMPDKTGETKIGAPDLTGVKHGIGDRVRDGKGFVGSVRYVGTVISSRNPHAIWVGVEWDDATRGKHDGMVANADGKEERYFMCVDGYDSTRGSFVKPHKVTSGETCLTSASEKYGSGESKSAASEKGVDITTNHSFATMSGVEVPVELVGMDMVKDWQALSKLVTVSLQGSDAATAGDKGELRAAFPKVKELNMGNTLVSNWENVSSIAAELPRLESLNLGSCRFAAVDTMGLPDTFPGLGAFNSLKVCVC